MIGRQAGRAFCMVMMLCVGPLRADDALEAGKRGDAAIRGMKHLPEGYSQTYYFEQLFGSKLMGYSELTLTVEKDSQGNLIYKYRQETKIQTPYKGKDVTVIEAKLSPHFVPVEVRVEGKITTPADQILASHEETLVGPEQVAITTGSGEDAKKRTIRRPRGIFVYATELVLEHIDLKKYPDFSLATFDHTTGRTVRSAFHVAVQDDMSQEVVAKWGKEDEAFIFVFDAEGRLQGWRQQPPTLDVNRVSRERYEELMSILNLE